MTIIFDTGDRVIPLLNQILTLLQKQGTTMADLATDLQALVDAVTSVTADVQSVLALLKQQPNITQDQVAQLEAQIAALQNVDASLKAAIPATPPTA